jgi:error-prone DNA polymerase
MRYVKGLREQTVQAIVQARAQGPFLSIDDLMRRVPMMRKTEATMLAEVGALNFVGAGSTSVLSTCAQDPDRSPRPDGVSGGRVGRAPRQINRRDAVWQVERAARPTGPLLEDGNRKIETENSGKSQPTGSGSVELSCNSAALNDEARNSKFETRHSTAATSPLAPMTPEERLVADFRGTGLTVGPHPMAYRRAEMKALGVRTASELRRIPNGRWVRIAGCVIARQRPGTAKGFVFLSLEDETGIANAIIVPDVFDSNRVTVAREQFLLIEGHLQQQDGVTSVKAERVVPLDVTRAETRSHDFH